MNVFPQSRGKGTAFYCVTLRLDCCL